MSTIISNSLLPPTQIYATETTETGRGTREGVAGVDSVDSRPAPAPPAARDSLVEKRNLLARARANKAVGRLKSLMGKKE